MTSSAFSTPIEPGQALRAPGAGDDAKLDLRQAAFGRRDRDAVMRRERDFEPAAERRSVQSGDHRLRGVLDCVKRLGERRRGGRLAELGNVGAGDEGPPVADEDDRLDRAVRVSLPYAPIETVADGLRKRVHRRRVDRHQRDFVLDREVDDRIDGGHGVFPLGSRAAQTSMTEREGEVWGFARPMACLSSRRPRSTPREGAALQARRAELKEFRPSL